MGSTTEPLTTRQVKALQALKELPVPPVPALEDSQLAAPPWWYRRAPQASAAGGLLFLCILSIWPLLTEPETWGGVVTLRAGSTITLTDQSQVAIPMVSDTGFLVLQGPARFEVARLNRHRISGKLQADLLLHEGELLLQCSPSSPKAIQIQTPLVRVRVTGTKLLVGHRGPEGSRVGVAEGKVLARPQGGWKAWERVGTGQIFKVTPSGTAYREELKGVIANGVRDSAVRGSTGSPRTEKMGLAVHPGPVEGGPPDLWRWLWREQE